MLEKTEKKREKKNKKKHTEQIRNHHKESIYQTEPDDINLKTRNINFRFIRRKHSRKQKSELLVARNQRPFYRVPYSQMAVSFNGIVNQMNGTIGTFWSCTQAH